jgi:ATP-binding cassette subfamily C protein
MCLFIGSYNILLGLLALAAYVTVGVIVPLVTSHRSGDTGLSFRNKSGDLSGFVLDSLRGLSETLQFNQGQKRLEQMNSKTHALAADEERMKCIAGQNAAITNTVILAFDLAMLFASAAIYQSSTGAGDMLVSSATIFKHSSIGFDGVLIPTLALMSSFGPCISLANLGSTLQNTFAAGNRVLDILDESPVVEEITGGESVEFSGAQAEHVGFAYGDEKILDDVSIQIPERSIVGIVGRSGSGKSTLLKLFMRFWQVQQGSVKISDTDVGQINTANLRDMESFMTQDTHLFHDSIRNNLRIAKLDASDEEIENACKRASIHEFIVGLPQGYDTPVGELGDRLSGGERQRLGLARAFLHDAPFMLLDEPTSNLDSLNEAVILKSLKEESQGKTVVLVSHRQSTMRVADTVYSVENGRMS